MKIGIDIDGVLTDFEKFIYDYGTKFSVENEAGKIFNPNEYDENKVFGWSNITGNKFWSEYLEFYASKYPARKFASEVIHKLKEEGNQIYIITARCNNGLPAEYKTKMKQIVAKWLEDNKIEYDKIIFTEGDKVFYCVGNYIDLMIEDSPKNVQEISKQIQVLCMNANYNVNIKINNVTRVYSWYDIYQKISSITNKSK